MPPKKAGAIKPTTTTTPTTPINKNNLITSATSPIIVKKAFGKLSSLFRALIDDMDEPLPVRVKAEILTQQGFEALAKKLSHAVTKYVLFVCQEGSISTIESQTQILLNVIRSVCVAIRAKLKDAGLTLQISLAETGTKILELLIALMSDLSSQISLEWKKSLDANGKFQSPLNDDTNQIVQITARVWSACESLGTMPLTDKDAIMVQGRQYAEMMKDALNEIKGVKEGEYQFPLVDLEESAAATTTTTSTTTTTTTPIDDEENTLPQTTSPPTNGDVNIDGTDDNDKQDKSSLLDDQVIPELTTVTESSEKEKQIQADIEIAAQFDTQDMDFNQNELSKSEFVWLQSGKAVITLVSGIVNTVLTKILPAMQHPAMVGDELNLKIPGALNAKKVYVYSLERRLKDLEKMAYYTDMLCNHLYSPQNIPLAAKYAWFLLSKTTRLLQWLELYQVNGWFKSIMGTPEGGMVFALENENSRKEEAQMMTLGESSKVFVKHSWWYDPLINPLLRPIVTAKNNEFITKSKSGPQYNRIHEFDDYNLSNNRKPTQKLPLISKWKWLNFQRKELFLTLYNSTTKEGKNVTLEHFKLQSFRFPIPQTLFDQQQSIATTIDDNTTTSTQLPIYTFTEDHLWDDKEDLAPDEDDGDDEDEDWDEDDDLFDDDFGLFSDSD